MNQEIIIKMAREAGFDLPTAAPEMPLSMNQFGRLVELTREHLTDNTFVYKATSKAGDTCHFGVESAAKAWAKGGTVEAIKVREFKLHTSGPTSDHLPNTRKMIETAAPVGEPHKQCPTCNWPLDAHDTDEPCKPKSAPVGEREAFERTMMDKFGWERKDFKTDGRDFYMDGNTVTAWMAWQARAALSAGEAVDGQRYRLVRRGQHFSIINGIGDTLRGEALDAAADAAMRKGQP